MGASLNYTNDITGGTGKLTSAQIYSGVLPGGLSTNYWAAERGNYPYLKNIETSGGGNTVLTPLTGLSVTGTPTVGQKLSVNLNNVQPENIRSSLSYQWQVINSSGGVAGTIGTGTSVTLTAVDVKNWVMAGGYSIRLVATLEGNYPNILGTTMTYDVPGGLNPIRLTGTLNITGTQTVNSTLTASLSGGPSGASYSWAWYRNGTGNALSTGNTYKLQLADVGNVISCVITGTTGTTGTLSKSTGTIPQVAFPQTPTLSAPNWYVGTTVTATVSGYTFNTHYTGQWYRGNTAISGANGLTYTLTAADANQNIKFRANGMGQYNNYKESAANKATYIPASGTVNLTVTDNHYYIGNTVTASFASPNFGVNYTAQWYRDSVAAANKINGATGMSYTLTAADKDHTLIFVATALVPYNGTIQASTAKVGPAPLGGNVVLSKTGNIGVNDVLIAVLNDAGGATYTWQWYRDSVAEGNKIAGATKYLYKVTTDDVGHTLLAQATGTNNYSGSVASEATASIGVGKQTVEQAIYTDPMDLTFGDTIQVYAPVFLPEGGTITYTEINATDLNGAKLPEGEHVAQVDPATGAATILRSGKFQIRATNKLTGYADATSETMVVTVQLQPLPAITGLTVSTDLDGGLKVAFQAPAAEDNTQDYYVEVFHTDNPGVAVVTAEVAPNGETARSAVFDLSDAILADGASQYAVRVTTRPQAADAFSPAVVNGLGGHVLTRPVLELTVAGNDDLVFDYESANEITLSVKNSHATVRAKNVALPALAECFEADGPWTVQDIEPGATATLTFRLKMGQKASETAYTWLGTVTGDNFAGQDLPVFVQKVLKGTLAVPADPVLAENGLQETSVALSAQTTAQTGAHMEYAVISVGGAAVEPPVWQTGPVFENLIRDTEYVLKTRIVGDENFEETIVESAGTLTVTTLTGTREQTADLSLDKQELAYWDAAPMVTAPVFDPAGGTVVYSVFEETDLSGEPLPEGEHVAEIDENGALTILRPGTFRVRTVSSLDGWYDETRESDVVTVNTRDVLEVAIEPVALVDLTYDYKSVETVTVTITNTDAGDFTVNDLALPALPEQFEVVTELTATELEPGASATYSFRPKMEQHANEEGYAWDGDVTAHFVTAQAVSVTQVVQKGTLLVPTDPELAEPAEETAVSLKPQTTEQLGATVEYAIVSIDGEAVEEPLWQTSPDFVELARSTQYTFKTRLTGSGEDYVSEHEESAGSVTALTKTGVPGVEEDLRPDRLSLEFGDDAPVLTPAKWTIGDGAVVYSVVNETDLAGQRLTDGHVASVDAGTGVLTVYRSGKFQVKADWSKTGYQSAQSTTKTITVHLKPVPQVSALVLTTDESGGLKASFAAPDDVSHVASYVVSLYAFTDLKTPIESVPVALDGDKDVVFSLSDALRADGTARYAVQVTAESNDDLRYADKARLAGPYRLNQPRLTLTVTGNQTLPAGYVQGNVITLHVRNESLIVRALGLTVPALSVHFEEVAPLSARDLAPGEVATYQFRLKPGKDISYEGYLWEGNVTGLNVADTPLPESAKQTVFGETRPIVITNPVTEEGTVQLTMADGTPISGDEVYKDYLVKIYAVPKKGYRFAHWEREVAYDRTLPQSLPAEQYSFTDDESVSTFYENPLILQVEHASDITAVYERVGSVGDMPMLQNLRVDLPAGRPLIQPNTELEGYDRFNSDQTEYSLYLLSGETDAVFQPYYNAEKYELKYGKAGETLTAYTADQAAEGDVDDTVRTGAPIVFAGVKDGEVFQFQVRGKAGGAATVYCVTVRRPAQSRPTGNPQIRLELDAPTDNPMAYLRVKTPNTSFYTAEFTLRVEETCQDGTPAFAGFADLEGKPLLNGDYTQRLKEVFKDQSGAVTIQAADVREDGRVLHLLLESADGRPVVVDGDAPVLLRIPLVKAEGAISDDEQMATAFHVVSGGQNALWEKRYGGLGYSETVENGAGAEEIPARDRLVYVTAAERYQVVCHLTDTRPQGTRILYNIYDCTNGADEKLNSAPVPLSGDGVLRYAATEGKYRLEFLSNGFLPAGTEIFTVQSGTLGVDLNAVVLRPGDVDGDGLINAADRTALIKALDGKVEPDGSVTANGASVYADLNDDGRVDALDLGILLRSISRQW